MMVGLSAAQSKDNALLGQVPSSQRRDIEPDTKMHQICPRHIMLLYHLSICFSLQKSSLAAKFICKKQKYLNYSDTDIINYRIFL